MRPFWLLQNAIGRNHNSPASRPRFAHLDLEVARNPAPLAGNIPGASSLPAPIAAMRFRVPTAQSKDPAARCLSGNSPPCSNGRARDVCSPWAWADRAYRQLLLAGAAPPHSLRFDCRQPLANAPRSISGVEQAPALLRHYTRRLVAARKFAPIHRARIHPQQPCSARGNVGITPSSSLLEPATPQRGRPALKQAAPFLLGRAHHPEKNL